MIVARLPRAHGSWRTIGRAVFVALFAASALPAQNHPASLDRPVADVRAPAASPAAGMTTPPARTESNRAATDRLAASLPASTLDAPGPSTAYEQAMAHAADRIDFAPGGRVTVAFTPRAGDAWPIDGRAPVALPGGRVTGRDMAAARQGSTWAEPGAGEDTAKPGPGTGTQDGEPGAPDVAPDAGAADPDDAIPATGASWTSTAPGPAAAEPDPAAASGLRRQVFGFLPYWELSNASTKLNYDVLSTIAYFSVGATAAGNLRKRDPDGSSTTGWGGWTSSSLTRVINDAHARGTRVVLTISVFAWSSSQASIQRQLLGSPAARANLARQAAAAVRDRGADGINLDFEPLVSGYESEFVALLKTIRAELSKIKKGYQLTYDTTGYIGNYPLEASIAAGAADAIFVMGYDFRTSGSRVSGSIDPLSGRTYDLTDAVRAYTSRVAPSKVILGLPWYGRAWSTDSADPRAANISSAKYGYSTAVIYESVAPLVTKYGRRWDGVEQSPYIAYRRENCTSTYGCITSWRQVWYDDAQSMKLRLAMVNDYGLRGAGVWALGYDGGRAELYRAFAESFLVDKSAPQAGVRGMAAGQPDEGFVVSWTAKDVSSIASYDVQVSTDGGPWATWLAATKARSEVYPGRDGHGYAFRVRARDAKGNTGRFTTPQVWTATPQLASGGFGRVVKDGLAYRSGPGTESVRLGSLPEGTIVAITRGPVAEDGYTWFEVTQPIKEWAPVSFVERGVWVAASGGGETFLRPYRSPASTRVNAGIAGLDFGPAGVAGTGSSAEAVAIRSFSPGRDGSEDSLRIRWTSTMAFETLKLRVFRANGDLVGSMPVGATGAGDRTTTWDGRIDGTRVPDGRYQIQLVGTAGGTTYTAPSVRPVTPAQLVRFAVTVDTVPPRLSSAAVGGSLISPNGDGRLDSVRLALAATGGAARWTITIAGESGSAVRSYAGPGSSAAVTWDGTDAAGGGVPDGRYTATLAAYDAAGNRAARAFPITVDTTPPSITPSVSPDVFAPNGDGELETSTLAWTGNEAASGTARIYKGTTLVRSWTIERLARWSVTWNGRRSDGTAVPDGAYAFKVDVRDPAGNQRRVSAKVVVDRTASSLRWAGAFYPQDSDALRSTSKLTWTLKRDAVTTLRIHDARGRLVRTAWTGKVQRAGNRGWTWDGRLQDGSLAPQGDYTARLTVTSSLGSVELRRDVLAGAFAIRPSATRLKPGQTLTVTVRTVEPLSGRPVVRFTQVGRPGVSVTAVKLPSGAYRASFTVRTGGSGTATIKVTGTDTGGRANSRSITVQVTT
jgi:spore germination protein YaaH/flagellar hook assembly protein FlgD